MVKLMKAIRELMKDSRNEGIEQGIKSLIELMQEIGTDKEHATKRK